MLAAVALAGALVGAGTAADGDGYAPSGALPVERGGDERGGRDGIGAAAEEPASRRSPSGDAPLAVVGGSWETLQQAPFEPRLSVPVAVGDALFVWGGTPWEDGGGRAFHDDGAVLRRKRWEALPPSPLEGRSGAAMAALDDHVVVWGGLARTAMLDDGALYDLARRRWRRLPPSPLSPRTDAAAVWTGEEVIVVGGRDNAGPLFDAAAYDPDADAWRSLPEFPATDGARSWGATSVWWIGSEVVAEWSRPTDGRGLLYRLDPDGGRWEPVEEPPRPVSGGVVIIGGADALVAVGRRADALAWSVSLWTGQGWEAIPMPERPSGVRGLPSGPGAVVVDGRLYLRGGADVIVLDLADRSWATLGDLPVGLRSQDLALVDGADRLMVWSTTERRSALWHPVVRGSG